MIRAQVQAFHEAMGVPTATTPAVPAEERVRLRLRLIAEEFCELLEAAVSASEPPTQELLHEARERVRAAVDLAILRVDLPAFVDALADLDYVVEGTRLEFGVDGAPIAAAVHAANMAKAGGARRPDGKVLKPAGWTPPDIAGELRRQGWTP